MANKVGELFVSLTADAKGFLSSIARAKKEASSAGKDMERDLRRPAESLDRASKAARSTADELARVRREAAGAGREIEGRSRASSGGGLDLGRINGLVRGALTGGVVGGVVSAAAASGIRFVEAQLQSEQTAADNARRFSDIGLEGQRQVTASKTAGLTSIEKIRKDIRDARLSSLGQISAAETAAKESTGFIARVFENVTRDPYRSRNRIATGGVGAAIESLFFSRNERSLADSLGIRPSEARDLLAEQNTRTQVGSLKTNSASIEQNQLSQLAQDFSPALQQSVYIREFRQMVEILQQQLDELRKVSSSSQHRTTGGGI